MSTSVIRWIGLIGAVCIWADTATAQSRTLDIHWVGCLRRRLLVV
jgi:hypothetical protein